MHFLVISLLTPYYETYDNIVALSCNGTPEFILTINIMVRMNSGVPSHDNASSFSFSFF